MNLRDNDSVTNSKICAESIMGGLYVDSMAIHVIVAPV